MIRPFASSSPTRGFDMIRLSSSKRSRFLPASLLACAAVILALATPPAGASPAKDDAKHPASKTSGKAASGKDAKTDAKKANDKSGKGQGAKGADSKGAAGKPTQLGTFGEWGAYQTQGKAKTCYALAQPKDRQPSSVKRDAAYIFISTRPNENVKNEISIIMGFPMKDGGEAHADINGVNFDLIAKGSNAWVKNPAEEGQFIDALKKGSKLVVKAASAKGKTTTDTYSLGGLSQALDKVHKECM